MENEQTNRAFMQLFMSVLGLKVIPTGHGKRDATEQYDFRQGLIRDYGAHHEQKDRDAL